MIRGFKERPMRYDRDEGGRYVESSLQSICDIPRVTDQVIHTAIEAAEDVFQAIPSVVWKQVMNSVYDRDVASPGGCEQLKVAPDVVVQQRELLQVDNVGAL